MVQQKQSAPFSRKLVLAGVVLTGLLVLASGAAFYYASRVANQAHGNKNDDRVVVKINADACDPMNLTLPAGKHVFEIQNKSQRAVEWEILDGVMVVEERENILPGFNQTITAKLAPGEYAITCGLLSNPRGKLSVTASAEHDAEKGKLDLKAFIGPLSEYQVYLMAGVAELQKSVQMLKDNIAAGDLDRARQSYVDARRAYARLSPVSEGFSDLDTAINARADYFEKRELDPAFGGLHRLEYGLFKDEKSDGLAPVADKLVQDAALLNERIRGLRTTPDRMLAGAASALNRFVATAGEAGEDRYAHTDLTAFAGLLEGAGKTANVLKDTIIKKDANAFAALEKQTAAVTAALQSQVEGNAYKSFDSLSQADKDKIKQSAAAMAAEFSKLRDNLGLD